jgi:hypothetical protein
MPKGFIHPLILEHHKQTIAELLDQSLADFARDHATHFISYFRDKILVNFGFYDTNDVSLSIKAMVLSAESKVRLANNLPQRGEGWLAEAEMVRLLTLKFSPHKVTQQYSPLWLQGMRLDAFIPDLNLAVEYQGEQHFRPIIIFGGEQGYSETVSRDRLKKELARLNNVTLEYITFEQNMDSEITRISRAHLLKLNSRNTQ